MTLSLEEIDVQGEIALLEAQGASSQKYYMHGTAHSMAFSKYAMAAKSAKESGNAAHAKQLRAIGKQHKVAADALMKIAGHHVDATFAKQQAAKNMNAIKEETEMTDETNPIQDLIELALDRKPVDFSKLVQEIIRERAAVALEDLREGLAEAFGKKDDPAPKDDDDEDEDDGKTKPDNGVTAGEEDEKLSEEQEIELDEAEQIINELSKMKLQKYSRLAKKSGKDRSKSIALAQDKLKTEDFIDEISVPPTGKTFKADKGKTVSDPSSKTAPTLKQGKNGAVKGNAKTPEQKSVSVPANDPKRENSGAT